MVITYQGDNYFKLQEGNITILIDPTNQRSFKGAQAVLNTVKPALTDPLESLTDPLWISHQGEYETKNVTIRGFSTGNDGKVEKTAYLVNFDEIDVAVLGYLTSDLGSKTIAALKGAQIAIVPAGGKPYLSQGAIAKIVKEINPSIIIPSLYKDVKPFLKEFKKTSCDTEQKLVFKAKDLKPAAMEIRCLKP